MTEPVHCDGCGGELPLFALGEPCPFCGKHGQPLVIDNAGPEDWTSVRDTPLTDAELNALDSEAEQQRLKHEKLGYKRGWYPYPWLEVKRLVYELRQHRSE